MSAKNRARQEKLEAYKREQDRRTRSSRIWIWSLSALAVLAVGAIVAVTVFGNQQIVEARQIDGLQTFENDATHVAGAVEYPQTPPAGGPHNAVWMNCGVYDQPVPNENAVHDLEHGAVWATYDPSLPQSEVDALIAAMPETYSVVSPYEGLTSPIVLSAWDAQVAIDSPDDPRLAAFVERFWQSSSAPEPGAPCTGGIDAPGKQ
ncbi:hypothetical protein C5E08_15455 [Rathayibacter iranicus]|uniref:DUF3105 domain-containing protein n=3 Tax=Rathayibacter iranicus TaxID=59737 RepID=A0AAD1AEZ5_9MICO|nr:DUF3105 domain-containing protein [Rathayibacter iranicus]AZZ57152.1 DUF3105 domain-containing protein [Rathayibacter iranicus]MWV29785.1 DUF3105 domain-containing protein [Rathayibacter iranicus NCPPB 2253 = VKM Ac-1602]PPI41394.1 hypothetical protein C5E09_14565 [Rathayibacter iranicus]PPI57422.1 hypothetical protein C5E08_15455 [Rathayibacter iranicus]PPI68289.1 hypothetical protein C5E01_14510 [Rathayibacter iranicus]